MLSDLLNKIDTLRILPKNKLLLYHRYVLSKISWHLTVADLSKTWVIEHLDNLVVKFVRIWLELPISATLSGISLPNNKFGLNLQLPSVKFQQCQTVLRTTVGNSVTPWKRTLELRHVCLVLCCEIETLLICYVEF